MAWRASHLMPMAPARDAAVDDILIDLSTRLVIDSQPLGDTWREPLQHHIGIAQQLSETPLPAVRFEVDYTAPLVTPNPVVQRTICPNRRCDKSGEVA